MTTSAKAWAVIALCASLSACSAMQGIGTAASALSPSGPSVDATAVVGAEAVAEGDAVIDTRHVEDRRVDAQVGEGGVSNIQTSEATSSLRDFSTEALNLDRVPPMYWLFLVLLWLSPGAPEIARFVNKMRRKDA